MRGPSLADLAGVGGPSTGDLNNKKVTGRGRKESMVRRQTNTRLKSASAAQNATAGDPWSPTTLMSEEARVMRVAELDLKSLGRFVPFVMRHRVLLRHWTTARRQYLRKLLPSKIECMASRAALSLDTDAQVSKSLDSSVTFSEVDVTSPMGSPQRGVSAHALGSPRRGLTSHASSSVRLATRVRSKNDGVNRHRFPVLVPSDKLERMVRTVMEEYRGLCIDAIYKAARIAVRGNMGGEEYAVVRDCLIDDIAAPPAVPLSSKKALPPSTTPTQPPPGRTPLSPGPAAGFPAKPDESSAVKEKARKAIQDAEQQQQQQPRDADVGTSSATAGGKRPPGQVAAREAFTVKQLLGDGLLLWKTATDVGGAKPIATPVDAPNKTRKVSPVRAPRAVSPTQGPAHR